MPDMRWMVFFHHSSCHSDEVLGASLSDRCSSRPSEARILKSVSTFALSGEDSKADTVDKTVYRGLLPGFPGILLLIAD